MMHYCNNFRRKPAITWFDWHFTPIYKSSQSIATITGSFLHHKGFKLLINRSPGFGSYIIWHRFCFFSLVFTTFILNISLNKPNNITRKSIIQKVRHHHQRLWLLVGNWIQVLFHYAFMQFFFNFHSRYSYTIGVYYIYP